MYISMMDSANKSDIPIFIRFKAENSWRPLYLSSIPSVAVRESALEVRHTMCFEKYLKRPGGPIGHSSLKHGLTAAAVRSFKEAAAIYAISSNESFGLDPFTNKYQCSSNNSLKTVRITLARRKDNGRRAMSNRTESMIIQALIKTFSDDRHGFNKMNIVVDVLDTHALGATRSAYQIRTVQSLDVVIATHGAFESNMLYLKEGSLIIEICGISSDYNQLCDDYHHLGKSFLVFHRIIKASNLIEHEQIESYNITAAETVDIVDTVRDYIVNTRL